jgi:protein-tyrosine phosphatase
MADSDMAYDKIKVLFVCMGNICRSPSAEVVFRNMMMRNGLLERVEIASAGTHGYHAGEPADDRSHAAALRRGLDLSNHRAQQLKDIHFEEYDYILVMDDVNYHAVMKRCPRGASEKVHYLMDFAPQLGVREVPDPYYGGVNGFDHVLDLVEAAAAGLFSEIRTRYIERVDLHPEINV